MTQSPAVRRAVLAALAAFCAAVVSAAPITPTLNYQGFLTDTATGLPIDAGKDMQFAIYSAATGGSLLFTESRCASGNARVTVSKGRYQVEIGSTTAGGVPHSVFTGNAQTWLEVRVDPNNDCAGFETLTPRVRLQAAPYAFEAARASTASHLSAGSDPAGVEASTHVFVVNSSSFGVRTATPLSAVHVVNGDIQISTTTGSNGVIYQDGVRQSRAAYMNTATVAIGALPVAASPGCAAQGVQMTVTPGVAITPRDQQSRIRADGYVHFAGGAAATTVCADLCAGTVAPVCPCNMGAPATSVSVGWSSAIIGILGGGQDYAGVAINGLFNPTGIGIGQGAVNVWFCVGDPLGGGNATVNNGRIIVTEVEP